MLKLKGAVVVAVLSTVVGLVGWPEEASAELPQVAGSVFGGDVSVSGRGALSAGLGWPSTFVRYDLPLRGRFGLGFRTDFFVGHPAWFEFGLGWGFDIPMRIQVLDRRNWSLSITIDPGFFVGFGHWYDQDRDWTRYDDYAMFGPSIGAGVVAAVTPVRFLNVFFGMGTTIQFVIISPDIDYIDPFLDVFVPIRPFGGIELEVARNIAIFASISAGPTFGSFFWCRDWNRDGECVDADRDLRVYFSGLFYFGAIFFF